MNELGPTGWLMIVTSAVAIAAGVFAVRWVVRGLMSQLLLTSQTEEGRGQRILCAVGYIFAFTSLPFGLFLGVTIGGTLGGGVGDVLSHRYGAAVGVGVGLGAVTLVVAVVAAMLGMLLCAMVQRIAK